MSDEATPEQVQLTDGLGQGEPKRDSGYHAYKMELG